jgi:hypothetical protein
MLARKAECGKGHQEIAEMGTACEKDVSGLPPRAERTAKREKE